MARTRQLTHVQQAPRSRVCGQTSVAIVTGVALERVIAVCGAGRGTCTEHHLRRGLLALGFTLDQFHRWRPQRVDGPVLMRVRFAWKRHGYHWIARQGRIVFDPGLSAPLSVARYDVYLRRRHGRLTSFAQVRERP